MKNGLVPVLFFLATGCIGASGGLMLFSKTESGITVALNAWQTCFSAFDTTNCQSITSDGTCSTQWNVVVAIRGVSIAACVDLLIAFISSAVSGCQHQGGPRPWARRFGWWGAILSMAYLGLVLAWWLNVWCDQPKSYQQANVIPAVGGYLVPAGAVLAFIGACCESCMADPRLGNNGTMTHVVLGSSLNDPNVVVGTYQNNNNNELRYQQQAPQAQQHDFGQYGKYGRGAADTNDTTEYRSY